MILNVPVPVTDLRREDVVSHIPDSLSPAYVGVAHSFHFGEDGAHCDVCGLVAFLIDEHPPVRHTESVMSHLSAPHTPTAPQPPTIQPSNHPTGKGMYSGDVDILHMPAAYLTGTHVQVIVVV